MGSLKTTSLGILMIVGAVVKIATELLNGHTPDLAGLYTAVLGGIGLIAAKDHKPLANVPTGLWSLLCLAVLALIISPALHAQPRFTKAISPVYQDPATGKTDRVFTASLFAQYLAHGADMATTREALADGAVERNPFLRPLYARAPGAAELASTSIVATSIWLQRRSYQRPENRWLIRATGFAAAGLFTALAVHNYHVATELRRRH